MDIPITISFKGNYAELNKDLFGLGDKVPDEKIPAELTDTELRYVNTKTVLMDGVVFKKNPARQYRIAESVESAIDYHYILSLLDMALGIGMNTYFNADKLLEKISNHKYRIFIDEKEVKSKDDFQKTLDEYIHMKKEN